MGKYLINHNRCPDCGNRLKSYYWYCGRCGNTSIVNWTKTAILAMIFVVLVVASVLTIRGQLCKSSMTAGIVNGLAPQFLHCQ